MSAAPIPRNRTVFTCPHAHVWHMPYAYSPYKLVIVKDEFKHLPRFYSYNEQWELLDGIENKGCECAKRWARDGQR